IGDSNGVGVAELIPLLKDGEPRVRLQAALALGRRAKSLSEDERQRALNAACALLRDNADRDAYLRHGGVVAPAGFGGADELAGMQDQPPAVRLGILLALRRLQSAAIRTFLSDPEPRLVVEAARAIHDVPIQEALPDLANLLESRQDLPDSFLYRALNAH